MRTAAAAPHLTNVNSVPRTAEGKVFHLELAEGDVAANVITVGSESRAKILSSLLDERTDNIASTQDTTWASTTPTARMPFRSTKGFVTYTGTFNSIPVSIIMINMGYPNMDFFVRELREVTEGPLRVIRLGSCAGLRPDLPVGTLAVAREGSILIRQNPDAWESKAGRAFDCDGGGAPAESTQAPGDEGADLPREILHEPYIFHGIAPADEELSEKLLEELKSVLGGEDGSGVVGCLNASADSFYSSQGRVDSSFEDRNDGLVEALVARHPSAGSFEMETFYLFHLARLCRKSTLQVSAASIVLANRIGGDAITSDRIAEIERKAGHAVLRTITSPRRAA